MPDEYVTPCINKDYLPTYLHFREREREKERGVFINSYQGSLFRLL